MEDDGNLEESLARIRKHRITPIDDVIAEERLIAVINGERTELTIQIGRPIVDPPGDPRCPVAIWGLDDRLPDIYGVSTMQALTLAISLAERRLADTAQTDEVTFYFPDGDKERKVSLSFVSRLFGPRRSRRRKPSAGPSNDADSLSV